jgi:hypothetical protein
MIVDRVGGNISMDRELRAKLLQETLKEKDLKVLKVEVPK